jgi:predicted ATPase/DNA-binding SARP family transcriptional activator
VQFRILGPLEVVADGAPIAVGGPKPRALLAALLVQRGTVVSTDRLIEVMWADRPPADALNALRAYVSRLRAALGSQVRLRYRAPGYRLDLADSELDAAWFVELLGAARRCAAAGEHDRVVPILDDALALWRGDALAEFADLDFAVAEIARLDDLRLAAIEDRIDALLHLDRHGEVVTELDGLARRFPLRERLAIQRMRGLYRSGRQPEALAVFRELRRRLVEELGVEPSEQAQELHRQVLAQDPALGSSRARTGGNLPRRVTTFVGRDEELARVAAAMVAAPLVTLTGMGGVGKSRLALEVAEQDRGRFPDGVWLCELAPLADVGAVGHAVAAALGVQQRHGLSIEQTVIEYLRTRTLLLVVDNCEHVLPAAARLVGDLVANCPGVVVLATSREPLGVDGEQVWPVPPLSVDDATVLFVHRARNTRPDFEPERGAGDAVSEICVRLDGLPLAIELAAARMRIMTATELAQRLGDSRLLVGGARSAQPRHQSLSAAIDWSYRLLAPNEQRLFARMSVFAGGADLAAVHGVCAEADTSDSDVLALLTRLVDKSMVVADPAEAATRYRMLETVRAHGRERLQDSGEDVALARRHARYVADLAEQAARGVQGPDEQEWVERVLPDRDNLRSAFEQAFAEGNGELTLRLATSMTELLHLRVGYESAFWAERTLDIAPVDNPLFAAAVGAAARGAWARGDFGYARSLATRAGGQVPVRGTARIAYPADVVADVALYEGDIASALRYWEAEVDSAREQDDPIRLVWTLYYVAVCHAVRREPQLGVGPAQESVRVADGTGNPTARSMARYALGLVGKKTDPDRALALLDEAAELAAQVHNFWWHGIAMMEAAATRAVHGDPAVAARALVEVLDHWDRVGDWTQQWLNLRYVVRLLIRVGAHDEAWTLHRCLVAAGKPSPLDDPGSCPSEVLAAPPLTGAEVVDLARVTLKNWV